MIEPRHIRKAIERTVNAIAISQEKPSPKMDIGGGSTIEPPTPIPVSVISAKRDLKDMLADWVDLIADGAEVVKTCDPNDLSMLAFIDRKADWLAEQDVAVDFLDELTVVTKKIEQPHLPRAGKKYIGSYGGGAVYIREGQRTVELADGTEVPVININDTNTDMVLNKTGTALQVSRIIKAYFKFDLDPKKIKDAERYDRKKSGGNKLEHVRIDDGAYVYKVEDVLNRLCSKEISPKT